MAQKDVLSNADRNARTLSGHSPALYHDSSFHIFELIELFCKVLLMCEKLGLIGKEMFAVDGCKLGSNASKEWSGTLGDLKKKQQKMEQAVRYLVEKHKETDSQERFFGRAQAKTDGDATSQG